MLDLFFGDHSIHTHRFVCVYLSQLLDASLVRHFGVLISLNAALEARVGEARGSSPGFARAHLHGLAYGLHVTWLECSRLEFLTVCEPLLRSLN